MTDKLQFFPTPAALVERMVRPHRADLATRCILDPSAGDGAILDYVVSCGGYGRGVSRGDVYAIEIDEDRVAILRNKGYRVIDRDFLSHAGYTPYDLILMNPPFREGARHLLHAWEILARGDIVCLLNAETLRNPFSRERQALAAIIENHGTVEDLGPAFYPAVGADVALVRLTKYDEGWDGVSADGLDWAQDREYVLAEEAALEPGDAIRALVARYDYCMRLLKESHVAAKRLEAAVRPTEPKFGAYQGTALVDQVQALRAHFWNYVFAKTDLGRYATKRWRESFFRTQEEYKQIEFNRSNILALLRQLVDERDPMLAQAAVDAFDMCTKYHKTNRHGVEGWAHNSAWLVAKKVIIPNVFGITLHHTKLEKFDDLDKVLAHLAGRPLNDILYTSKVIQDIYYARDFGTLHRSEFFEVKLYIKATVHLRFLDEDLWAKFNRLAAQGKGWQVGDGHRGVVK